MSIVKFAFRANRFALLLVSIALAGCATAPSQVATDKFIFEGELNNLSLRNYPAINEVTKVELGGSLVGRSFTKKIKVVNVDEVNVVREGKLGWRFNIKPGMMKAVGRTSAGTYYLADKGNFRATEYLFGLRTIHGASVGGLVVDDSMRAVKIFYSLSDPGNSYFPWHEQLEQSDAVRVEKMDDITLDIEGSFLRELVYGGIANNVLTLVYREYKNGFARPAFTQELKYDLAIDKIVGYKGARFEVMSATNTELTYKVLAHLQ